MKIIVNAADELRSGRVSRSERKQVPIGASQLRWRSHIRVNHRKGWIIGNWWFRNGSRCSSQIVGSRMATLHQSPRQGFLHQLGGKERICWSPSWHVFQNSLCPQEQEKNTNFSIIQHWANLRRSTNHYEGNK